MVILITGARGQLGQALRSVSVRYPKFTFIYTDSGELDITNRQIILDFFTQHKPDFCINTAAYTAVDKAESEQEVAELINVDGARNLAEVCAEFNTTLIHISTDFVFDGESAIPYSEDDVPNPKSIYGLTKLDGELAIAEVWHKHFIIRTSWVYSEFGNNFMKTMLKLATTRTSLSVVSDQVGTPTYAVDLAGVILDIISKQSSVQQQTTHKNPQSGSRYPYGIYNYSNGGQCSWYDFAEKIFEVNKIEIDLHAIPTTEFPTAATRPKYSVLDKQKLIAVFGIKIRPWQDALISASLANLTNNN